MLIGYLFDNNYWDLKKILYFYFCPQMLPSVRTFYCPNISGQKYLPWLSGPETKNLSFPLSFLYSLHATFLMPKKQLFLNMCYAFFLCHRFSFILLPKYGHSTIHISVSFHQSVIKTTKPWHWLKIMNHYFNTLRKNTKRKYKLKTSMTNFLKFAVATTMGTLYLAHTLEFILLGAVEYRLLLYACV